MSKPESSAVSAALYARVSSDAQAQEQTIDSQVADLRKQAASDEVSLVESNCFLDDGVSGSTLNRPALERLRDTAYVGGFQRLYVHSPDRLARKYAYQVLIIDELQKQGIEIIFLNRAIGASPEEDLLLQMQGMFAEYERAKIMERSRRGKRHGATRGSVNASVGRHTCYRACCNASAAATPTTAKRSVAAVPKVNPSGPTIDVLVRMLIALAASVFARTNRCVPTCLTKRCGKTLVSCCDIRSYCEKSTSVDWLRRRDQTPWRCSKSNSPQRSVQLSD